MEGRHPEKPLADLKPKHYIVCIWLAAAIMVAAVSVLPKLNAPFALDESEEALIGQTMITEGARTFAPVGKLPLSHPLLYSITHSWVQRIFGSSETVVRAYGFFHFLLSLVLLLLIVGRLFKDNAVLRRRGWFIAAVLYLVNPLLLQHSLVINADNNILTTAILIFIYFFLRYEDLERRGFIGSRFPLAVLMALCFWSKEMAPLFLICGVLAYRVIARQWEKLKFDFLITCLGGLAVFWASWWAYCAFTGLDVFGFIKYTVVGKSRSAFGSGYLRGIFHVFFYGIRWHLYWVSAPFLAAVLMYLIQRGRAVLKEYPVEPADLLMISGVAIWVPFQFFRPNIDMMKYQYPAYPLFIAALSWLFARNSARRPLEGPSLYNVRNMAAVTVTAILLYLHYYRTGDYLLALWQPMSKYLDSHFYLYYYLPLVLIGAAAVLLASSLRRAWANLYVSLVLLVVPISAGLDINQAKAGYATAEIWLNYGEAGLRPTIEYLKDRITPGSVTMMRQDLEQYMRYRCGLKLGDNILPHTLFLTDNDALVRFILSQAPIEYLVLDEVSTRKTFNNSVVPLIAANFTLEKNFGDFYIFHRKAK